MFLPPSAKVATKSYGSTARMRPLLLAAALLLKVCRVAASNATSHRRRLIAERVDLPKPGTGTALEELRALSVLESELGKARVSAAAYSKDLAARIDLSRRFERPKPVDATVSRMAGSVRRSRELSSLHRLEATAQERAAKMVVGDESVCVAVPCAPKHWPLMPRVMRSVAQQTLTPHKVIVALSHTDTAACAAKQAELNVIHLGALLHCTSGSGWTRGKNRNLAAAACGNVSLAAHLLTSALTSSTYSLTTTHDGLP